MQTCDDIEPTDGISAIKLLGKLCGALVSLWGVLALFPLLNRSVFSTKALKVTADVCTNSVLLS